MAIYKDVEPLEVVTYKGENEDFDRGVIFILEKLDALPIVDVMELNKKNTPQKLKVEVDNRCGVRNLYYFCPHCNSFRIECRKYCSNCGQALDWEETFSKLGLKKAIANLQRLCEEDKVLSVVKCKDCKHKRRGIQGVYCGLTDFLIKDDDFCSRGEFVEEG